MKCRGRAVEIRTFDGHVYRGLIDRVDGDYVYLRPFKNRPHIGGFSYGFGGFWPYHHGRFEAFAVGIALGAIATLVLLPFFFW